MTDDTKARASDRVCQSYAPTLKRLVKRIIGKFKSEAKHYAHGVWWRFLWAMKLGKPYSQWLCRNGWYYQYQRGVCGYCGEKTRVGGHK